MTDISPIETAEWRLAVIDLGQTTYLPQWQNMTYQQVLIGADILTFEVNGDDITSALIRKRKSDIFVYRDQTPMGRLRCMTRPIHREGGKRTITVGAVDFRQVLYNRILHVPVDYLVTDQADILWNLIDYTQDLAEGDLGLTRGTYTTGTPRDRHYEAGATIGQLCDQLADVIGGFDWWQDHLLAVHMESPRRYRDMHSVVLTEAACSKLNDDPAIDFTNIVRVTGSGTVSATAGTPVAGEGRWERSVNDPDLIEQATVDARADRLQAEGSFERRQFDVTLEPDEWGAAVNLACGDVCTVRIVDDVSGNTNTLARVHAITFNVGVTESVSMTLLEEEPA